MLSKDLKLALRSAICMEVYSLLSGSDELYIDLDNIESDTDLCKSFIYGKKLSHIFEIFEIFWIVDTLIVQWNVDRISKHVVDVNMDHAYNYLLSIGFIKRYGIETTMSFRGDINDLIERFKNNPDVVVGVF